MASRPFASVAVTLDVGGEQVELLQGGIEVSVTCKLNTHPWHVRLLHFAYLTTSGVELAEKLNIHDGCVIFFFQLNNVVNIAMMLMHVLFGL